MREGKGTSAGRYLKDYCIVDLETTSIYISSARIIEISAIKVRDNQVVDEYSTLVNPKQHIPADATAVNHITDEMVMDAPHLENVIGAFKDFVGADVIVGYNNASFDMNLLYDELLRIRNEVFENDYIDVLHSARRCLTDLENCKLETICRHYHVDTTGEHRALKDCYLTKACYEKLFEEFGEKAFQKSSGKGNHRARYSSTTLALRDLDELLKRIIADGKVTITEFSVLKDWMEAHDDLQGEYPFDRVFNALDQVLEDGVVTSDELIRLQKLFSGFVDPVKASSCHDIVESITGLHMCVTGDFNYGSRSKVLTLIEQAGGIVDKNVKKATNLVVVGAKGSDSWKAGNYGGKIQKAMELKDKGQNIKVLEEADFIPAVEHTLENSISEEIEIDGRGQNNWKQEIRLMLEKLAEEYKLPVETLYLSDNYGQKGKMKGKIVSHSVCIWEPDYPRISGEKREQNKIVVTISLSQAQSRPNDIELRMREAQEKDLQAFLPGDAEVLTRTKTDIDAGAARIRMQCTSPNLVAYIRANTAYCIERYESKANKFGCCSMVEQCSDAGKCLHENLLYSKACMYRENLEHGKIFYGKNRNSDRDTVEIL